MPIASDIPLRFTCYAVPCGVHGRQPHTWPPVTLGKRITPAVWQLGGPQEGFWPDYVDSRQNLRDMVEGHSSRPGSYWPALFFVLQIGCRADHRKEMNRGRLIILFHRVDDTRTCRRRRQQPKPNIGRVPQFKRRLCDMDNLRVAISAHNTKAGRLSGRENSCADYRRSAPGCWAPLKAGMDSPADNPHD